jgi:CubicO group peptidase (beta-lactamase class C family)
LLAAPLGGRWEDTAEVLWRAAATKQVEAAVLHVVQRDESFSRHSGEAASDHAMFLLGSISKPINVTAAMSLFGQRTFQLDDRVKRFLPAFTGDGRDAVTVRHLLTHGSGLPDRLAENNEPSTRHSPSLWVRPVLGGSSHSSAGKLPLARATPMLGGSVP